jgi:hypothetical protein
MRPICREFSRFESIGLRSGTSKRPPAVHQLEVIAVKGRSWQSKSPSACAVRPRIQPSRRDPGCWRIPLSPGGLAVPTYRIAVGVLGVALLESARLGGERELQLVKRVPIFFGP